MSYQNELNIVEGSTYSSQLGIIYYLFYWIKMEVNSFIVISEVIYFVNTHKWIHNDEYRVSL